jgi:2-oxoisovalerate dehydrogenase E1 component
MLLAREADRREGILYRQGRGWFALHSAGHEPMACLAPLLRAEDYKFLYYRDRALLLALGWTVYDLALEYFARELSSSAGRQMPSFPSDRSRNIVTMAPPTGLQYLPAAGCAWACKRGGEGRITICTTGEAATREGEFYEALCFAREHTLPVVFVVEDNGWGISTPTARINPLALGVLDADLFVSVDGRNVNVLTEAAARAVDKARRGKGPSVLWVEFDRLGSHSASDDHRGYRTPDDLKTMERRDFIGGIAVGGDLCDREREDFVANQYELAESSDEPDSSALVDNVFASGPLSRWTHGLKQGADWTMAEAINRTLHELLAASEKVLLFGQDIEDPKGGVFGLTRGLSSEFPGRVVNAPLAEATIAGTASGLAMAGLLPIFELQFIDFAGPAFNQIVNQIATVRWRSRGAWKNPMILMAPAGGYLPAGGPWHSQSSEGFFAHAPGLRIVMPSTPADAAALLRAAASGDDPVLFLIPKHLLRRRVAVTDTKPIGLGEAAIRRLGTDVTLVAWGNCVWLALEAADILCDESVSAEVIDLRSLSPCDWGTIRQSLEKTGRLVVIQEDNRTCGFGQSLIAEAVTRPEIWNLLAARPELVSRPDVHIGFHPSLEASVLPSVSDIVTAVRRMLDGEV